ncbi:MAG: TonB-dependent receptor, partial [Bacteroidota bacterium]
YEIQSAILREVEFEDSNFFSFTEYISSITDIALQSDFEWHLTPQQIVRFGLGWTRHQLEPYAIQLDNEELDNNPDLEVDSIGFGSLTELLSAPLIESDEYHLYGENEWQFGEHWQLNAGMRLSAFSNGEIFYFTPEPRLHLRYTPNEKWQYSMGVSHMAQYLHLLSQSGLSLPNDLWVSSSDAFRPQRSWQAEVGTRCHPLEGWVIQADLYYKNIQDLLFIDDDVVPVDVEEDLDDFISPGQGQAYGLELSLKKEQGRIGGWLNYTLARSSRQLSTLNLERAFNFQHDSRHQIKLFLYQQLGQHFKLGLNFIYQSPRPLLALNSESSFIDVETLDVNPVGAKNARRGPSYHRMDLNLTYSLKQKRLAHTFKLGAFNVYNRDNAVFHRAFADGISNEFDIEAVSVLGFTPSIYYEIKF